MTADARSFLVQKLERFQAAAKSMREQLASIEKNIKEVQEDLILVIAALDDLEEEAKRDAA